MKSTLGSYYRDLSAGVTAGGVTIFVQTWLMGFALIFLDIALVIALWLWAVQTKRSSATVPLRIYLILVGLQCFHFLEEYLTGFHSKFPPVWGFDYAWSAEQFATLNLIWIAVWVLNGAWLVTETRLSYLPAYFIAVGGIMNGIGHPLLSLMEGGYFPGLITSPFVFIAGVLLFKRLSK